MLRATPCRLVLASVLLSLLMPPVASTQPVDEEQEKEAAGAQATSSGVALGPSGGGSGASVSVPYVTSFTGGQFGVTGSDLIVRVVVDPDATESSLSIKDPGIAVSDSEFSFSTGTGVLTRTVAPPGDGEDSSEPGSASAGEPFLVEVEAVVPAGTTVALQLQYSEVDVVFRGPEPNISSQLRTTVNGVISAGRLGVRGPFIVSFNLTDGELDVNGTDGAHAGPVRVTLHSSVANLGTFGGNSRIGATDSTVAIRNANGTVDLAQQGGQITIVDSASGVTGRASNGTLDIEDVSGQALRLELDRAELSVDRSSMAQWSLSGRESTARLTRNGGMADFTWTAGLLGLEDHSGVVTATLNPAAVFTSSGLRERAVLTLNDAEATIESAADVNLTLRDASVNVDGCKALAVDASDSELNLAGFESQGRWRLEDSRLEADFSSSGRGSKLKLDGRTEASVLLPGPCFVRFNGRSNLVNSTYKINGCEVITADPTQRKRLRAGGLNGLDGSGGTILQLDLADTASVVIGES